MKSVCEFYSSTEAQIFSGYLKSHGIENAIEGAREYTTIIIGGTGGKYQIFVNDEDFEKALDLVREYNTPKPREIENPSPRIYIKKAVMFIIIATLILPIIFHFYSAKNFFLYLKSEASQTAKVFWTGILVPLWITSLYVFISLLKNYSFHYLKDVLGTI